MIKLFSTTNLLTLLIFSIEIFGAETGENKDGKQSVKNSGKKIGDQCETENFDGGWAEVNATDPGSFRLICVKEGSEKKWKKNYGWGKSPANNECYEKDAIGLSRWDGDANSPLKRIKCKIEGDNIKKGIWVLDQSEKSLATTAIPSKPVFVCEPKKEEKEPEIKFPEAAPSSLTEMSLQEEAATEAIIENLLDDIQTTGKQRRHILEKMIELAERAKKNGGKSNVKYFTPTLHEAYYKDILLRRIMDETNLQKRPFSNLHARYNGLLTPKDPEMFQKYRFGKIIGKDHSSSGKMDEYLKGDKKAAKDEFEGKLLLYPNFNVADVPMEEIVQNLLFVGKERKGFMWNKTELKLQEFIALKSTPNHNNLNLGLSCQMASGACKDFAIFEKHLKKCDFSDAMIACINAASEKSVKKPTQAKKETSTGLDKYLEEFYDEYFTKTGEESLKDEEETIIENASIDTILTKRRFPTKESFVSNSLIRKNAVWTFVLHELSRRELYYLTHTIFHGKNPNEEIKEMFIAPLVEDIARYFAKIDQKIHEGQSVIASAAVGGEKVFRGGDALSVEISKYMKEVMDKATKELEDEEKGKKTDVHEEEQKSIKH